VLVLANILYKEATLTELDTTIKAVLHAGCAFCCKYAPFDKKKRSIHHELTVVTAPALSLRFNQAVANYSVLAFFLPKA
jgi:hypothetical protein